MVIAITAVVSLGLVGAMLLIARQDAGRTRTPRTTSLLDNS